MHCRSWERLIKKGLLPNLISPHHITSHHIISHHVVSYHIISRHITSHHITSHNATHSWHEYEKWKKYNDKLKKPVNETLCLSLCFAMWNIRIVKMQFSQRFLNVLFVPFLYFLLYCVLPSLPSPPLPSPPPFTSLTSLPPFLPSTHPSIPSLQSLPLQHWFNRYIFFGFLLFEEKNSRIKFYIIFRKSKVVIRNLLDQLT